MCFGGGSQPQQQIQPIQYVPYNNPIPYYAQPGGGFNIEPQYPLASQVYQQRFNEGAGGYGYPGVSSPGSNAAAGSVGVRPTSGGGGGGGITNIGSDAHMGSVPGASQLLGQQSNQGWGGGAGKSPISGWF